MNKDLIVKIDKPNTICVGNKTQELKQPQKNGVV